MNPFLQPEDYLEPTCPLCDDPYGNQPQRIPLGRVIEKLDEYIDRKETEKALKHLEYWIAEAERGKDAAGALSLLNEKMGVLRNAERHTEAIETALLALRRMREASFCEDTVGGTTYLNAATVFSAAGQPQKAVELYRSAEAVYEKTLPPSDGKWGGLMNNLAVALCAVGDYAGAREAYGKALEIMKGTKYEFLERAVTYTNLASLSEAESGMEEGEKEISRCLLAAKDLLDAHGTPQVPYAAYVYEKCAAVFDYYGWFFYAAELKERAKTIYART